MLHFLVENLNANFLSKSFKVVFLILSLGLCSYQVYKITVLYLSYTTTTSVSYEKVSVIPMPGLTLCFCKTLLLRDEYKQELSEKYGKQLNKSELICHMNSLPISSQRSVMYSMSDIFNNSCRVLKPIELSNSTGHHIPCDMIAPVRETMDYDRKCFTFLTQLNGEPDNRYLIKDDLIFKDFLNDLFNIEINNKFKTLEVIIHSRDEPMINRYRKRILKYEYTPNKVFYAEYHITRIHTLPEPYETHCYDYTSIGYKSRYNCIESCRIDQMADYVNGWPGNYLTDNLTSDEPMVDMYAVFKENKTLDEMFAKKCRQLCGTFIECCLEYYEVRQSTWQLDTNRFYLTVFPPYLRTLVITHSPKLSFEEYVSLIGSLISLWFGLSVICLTNGMTDVCAGYLFAKLVDGKQVNNSRVSTGCESTGSSANSRGKQMQIRGMNPNMRRWRKARSLPTGNSDKNVDILYGVKYDTKY